MTICKNVLSVILLTIGLLPTVAETITNVTIGDFKYNLNKSTQTAEIIGVSNTETTVNAIFPSFVEYDGNSFSVTKIGSKSFAKASAGIKGTLQLPSNLEIIGAGAFQDNTSITGNLIIPDKVRKIENSAFRGCSNLSGTLYISKSIHYINEYALAYTHFDKVTINGSGYAIEERAFSGAKCKSLFLLGSDIMRIGDYAFTNASIDKIVLTTENPPKIYDTGGMTFPRDMYYSTKVYVPDVYSYKTTDGWRNFQNILSIVNPKSISLNVNSLTLKPTECFYLIASVLPTSSTINDVFYTSSNQDVVTVDVDGKLTGISIGSAKITATTANGLTTICDVNVLYPEPTSIELNPSKVTMKTNETLQLKATILPEDASDKSVLWSSSDESVATVDENGIVTAVGAGNAVITATTADGSNLSAECAVTVIRLVEEIHIDPEEILMEAGQIRSISASVLPEEASDKNLKWSSSNENVATVNDNGTVTGVNTGTSTITVSATDGSGVSNTCEVIVSTPTDVNNITYEKLKIAIEKDTLILTGKPADMTVRIFNTQGILVMETNEDIVHLEPRGIYTVVAGSEVYKVIL